LYIEIDDNEDKVTSKIDYITLQVSKPLFNTGATVTMDNHYMSKTCAMKL
jgi:hypothetical protein